MFLLTHSLIYPFTVVAPQRQSFELTQDVLSQGLLHLFVHFFSDVVLVEQWSLGIFLGDFHEKISKPMVEMGIEKPGSP